MKLSLLKLSAVVGSLASTVSASAPSFTGIDDYDTVNMQIKKEESAGFGDDYDEINLNLRLLQNNNFTGNGTGSYNGAYEAGVTVPAGTSCAAMNNNQGYKTASCSALTNITNAGACTMPQVSCPSRALRELYSSQQRRGLQSNVTLTLTHQYTLTFASPAAAASAANLINSNATLFQSQLQ